MKDLFQITFISVYAYFGTMYVHGLKPHEFKVAAIIVLPVVLVLIFIGIHFFVDFMRKGFIEAERRIEEKKHERPIRF
jgi:hypothetical protein